MRSCRKTSSCVLTAEEQFHQLRPSKELLYYRRKLQATSSELQGLQEQVERCREVCDREQQLEKELQRSRADVLALQEALSDTQVCLYQEREQVLRAVAESERVKARTLQDRRKITYLLTLTGTSEKEVNLVCNKPWPRNVPQRPAAAKASVPPNRRKVPSAAAPRSAWSSARGAQEAETEAQALRAENEALQQQVKAQSVLWREQLQVMLREKELQRQEAALAHHQSQDKISSLSRHLEETQELLLNTLRESLEREKRRCDVDEANVKRLNGSSEHKLRWSRGDGDTAVVLGGGRRRADDICAKALKEELTQREQVIKMYQEQCMLQEERASSLQQQLENCRKQTKERSQRLLDTIATLKSRHEQLDQRRRLEAEGFRSDVRLLRQRLAEVERAMVRIARVSSTVEYVDTDILSSAADTLNKAEQLGKELLSIKKKVADMEESIRE